MMKLTLPKALLADTVAAWNEFPKRLVAVKFVLASPFASVTGEGLVSVPSPGGMVHVIATPATGRPDPSLACTTIGAFDRVCSDTIWPFPETMLRLWAPRTPTEQQSNDHGSARRDSSEDWKKESIGIK